FNGVFQNVESVTLFFDCLGSHFTWLQSIFTNFPALLNFVNKMKCVTGLCPRDFEDYGCSCRFEMEGLPVDETDSCCFQHRKCYEEAVEMECMWDPAKISTDFSCLTKNLTCRSGDPCEQLLCNCDKAAIECFVHSRINSSLNGLDVSFYLPDSSWGAASTTLPGCMPATCMCRCTGCPYFQSPSPCFPQLQEAPCKGKPGSARKIFEAECSEIRDIFLKCYLFINAFFFTVCDRFTFLQIRGNGKVKQELPQLGEMLYCLTDRCPQEFESYGCYCGQEGRGSPADVLDRCCFSHHCCMEQVRKLGCHPERILRSEVVCFDHKPKCIGWSMCEKLLCSCDQTAAECMAAAVFNDSLKAPSQQDCQEETAPCWSATHERPSSGSGIGTRASSSEESSEEAGPRSVLRRGKRGARFSFGKDYSAPLHGR
uniref:Otoconin 90 n=1 Tax=Crocodylus porosus TaxID=8502 RepID=A0A7M4EXU3_CROPO